MDELFDSVFRDLDGRTGDLSLQLLAMPLEPHALLRAEVVAYRVKVREASEVSPSVDLRTAEGIAAGCLALLNQVDEDAPFDQQALVQAACRYYVLQEDGGRDLHAPLGFDDDAEVFNAVARHLGRPDLVVQLG